MILECYGNSRASLLLAEIKLKMVLMPRNYQMACSCQLLWLSLRLLNILNLTPRKQKGNYLTDSSVMNTAFKEPNNQISIIIQLDDSPKDKIEKLTRMHINWPQKRKNKIESLITVSQIKRENFGLGQITIQSAGDSNIPIIDHCKCSKSLVC